MVFSPSAEARLPKVKTCVLAVACSGIGAIGGAVTTLCIPALQAIRTGFVDLEAKTQLEEIQRTQFFLAESLQKSCRKHVATREVHLSDEDQYILRLKPETLSLSEIDLLLNFTKDCFLRHLINVHNRGTLTDRSYI